MDPQKLSQLDPKLREAYQRVMGTPIPEPQVAPMQAQTPPTPTPPMPDPTPAPSPQSEPEPAPTPPPAGGPTIEEPPAIPMIPEQPPTIPEPAIPEPQPAIPQPEPIPTPEPVIPNPPAQANNFVQMHSEVASAAPTVSPNFVAPVQTQTVEVKKKGMMMPILIAVVILVFLAIYALFWVKIFNFQLPFLP